MLIDTNKDDKYINGRYFFFQLSESKRAGYFDFSNLQGDEGKKTAQEFIKFFKENEFSNITGRAFVDFTNTRLNHDLLLIFKEMAKAGKKVSSEKTKLAGIGRFGMSNIYINIFTKLISNNIKAFNTKEEAFAWLAED